MGEEWGLTVAPHDDAWHRQIMIIATIRRISLQQRDEHMMKFAGWRAERNRSCGRQGGRYGASHTPVVSSNVEGCHRRGYQTQLVSRSSSLDLGICTLFWMITDKIAYFQAAPAMNSRFRDLVAIGSQLMPLARD
jgi:hypothetical protein